MRFVFQTSHPNSPALLPIVLTQRVHVHASDSSTQEGPPLPHAYANHQQLVHHHAARPSVSQPPLPERKSHEEGQSQGSMPNVSYRVTLSVVRPCARRGFLSRSSCKGDTQRSESSQQDALVLQTRARALPVMNSCRARWLSHACESFTAHHAIPPLSPPTKE